MKDFNFTFIELLKFPKTKEDQLENMVEKWCYFFKYASETSEKDLKKIVGSDVVIGKAYNELVGYNWTEEEQAIYEWSKKNKDDNVSCLKQSRIGGRKVRNIEMAKAMLANNVDVDTIAKYTGLFSSEIEKLKSN